MTDRSASIGASREQSVSTSVPVEVPDVEMTSEPTQEELVKIRKAELLQSIQRMKSYEWTQLTSEFIENPDNVDDFLLRIDNDINIADEIFYEIIYAAKFHSDRLPIAKLGEILDKLFDFNQASQLFFKFMKIFNSFKLDDNLRSLIDHFKKLPNIDIAKHSNNSDFIQERNIIADYKKTSSGQSLKLVQQKRFNLYAESNEGYSKLMVLLNQAFASDDSYFQVYYVAKAIDRITGHFHLDPFRVLDVIIDILIFSIPTNHRFAFDLLRKTQFWPVIEADCSSLETLDKGGNENVAKLLASKLKQYSESEKELVESMKTAIALFIKQGLISFGSILKYIGPDESSMDELNEFLDKKIDEEIFKSSANALALSGPLADDEEDEDPKKKSKRESQKPKESGDKKTRRLIELNYKVQITKQLLANGVYWPTVYMLNKYPYMVNSDSDFTKLILRLFNVIVEPLKSKLKVLTDEQFIKLRNPQKVASSLRSSVDDNLKFEEYKYTTIESFKPLTKSHTNKIFVYFDSGWADQVPRAHNYEELFSYSHKILSFLGAKLAEDPPLVSYLCQFGCDDLKSVANEGEREEKLEKWFNYFKKFILPASTAIGDNPVTSSDIYELLSKFPLDWRYNLYGDLYQNISKNDLSVKLNYLKAEKQTKDILKRITKDNVKPMMRRMAKITYSNPLPSFLIILQQIENYDNLTNLIIEAARYFTEYAWDVLPFALLIRLTSSNRVAVQSDGLNDSPWLQSLSSFIAKLAKRYSYFNLDPMLTFILKDLHKNNTVGLTILRELINQMGGIQPLTNLSLSQIKLLNSSPTLQKIVRKVIFDTRDESKDSARRLIKSLIQTNQLSEIFILLIDFARELVQDDYEDDGQDAAYLKVLSQKIDEITNVLHTYIELVNYFLIDQNDVFAENVTNINELVTKYRTDPTWGFELWRRHLTDNKEDELEVSSVEFDSLTKKLYYDFWRLNLYDIEFDEILYSFEKEKLIKANETIAGRISRLRSRDVDNEKPGLLKTEALNKALLGEFTTDTEIHQNHTESILSEIKELFSKKWFKDAGSITTKEIQSFLQYCVIPRALQSSSDAIFAVRFITNAFDTKTSQIILSALLESDVLNTLIFTLTPIESENLGIFFADVFSYYEKVRLDESVSNDEKEIIFKWHIKFLQDIKIGIKSENYMSRRNSITLLKNLIGIYPIIEDQSEELVAEIQKVSQAEKRNDLKLASAAILSLIHSKSKSLIHLWDFYKFDDEERTRLQDARNEVLKEREEEKLRLKQEAIKREREERMKYYQRPTSSSTEPKSEDAEKEKKDQEAKVEDEDFIIEDEDESEPAPKVEAQEKKSNDKKAEENDQKKNKDDGQATKKEDEAKSDELKAELEEDIKPKLDLPAIPSGPRNAIRTKFADVTADVPSKTPSGPKLNPYDTLRSLVDALDSNGIPGVLKLIDDKVTFRDLENSQKNPSKSQEILLDHARRVLGGARNGIAFKTFSENVKKHFSLASSNDSSQNSRQRKPLEPQESISGFSSKPNSKWGMNNRAIPRNNRQGYGQGNNYNSSGGQYSQGYRNAKQPAGNAVPPPPPPPPRPSGQQKRTFDRQRYDSDKRPRRN